MNPDSKPRSSVFSGPDSGGPVSSRELWLLAALCLGAFVLFTYNNDFPLYFHADEWKKVEFVIFGDQDFKHPILLLQLAKFANLFFREINPDSVAIVGRYVSAIAGIAILVAGYLLSRHLIRDAYCWLAVSLMAISPILVVHAHYFKEDMVFTAACLFSVLFYIRFLDRRGNWQLVGLAVATGLAFSAQYKSVLLVPLYLLFPLLDSRIDRKGLYPGLLKNFGLALVIAVIVNYPALFDLQQLLYGISFEARHVTTGHTLEVHPLPHYFSYHLVNSLVPGLTLVALAFGIAGLLAVLLWWKRMSTGWRFLAVYAITFYFAHEVTPMKPAPGFMRYMIPITPVLLIFAASFTRLLVQQIEIRAAAVPAVAAVVVIVAVVAAPSLYRSMMLVRNLNENDTRLTAYEWLAERQDEGNVYFGKHTLLQNKKSGRVYVLNAKRMQGLRDHGFKYAISSSFGYDPYTQSKTMPDQSRKVRRASQRFDSIFEEYPYHEIEPDYMSFAFSNPTIRIIDISKDPAQQ